MSKNFELMQQAGKNPQFRPSPRLGSQIPLVEEPANGNSHRGEAISARDDAAGEEVLRLVQRVFLLEAGETPRVVVFAGIDHGNGCSRICARAAETLAKNHRGSVCLVDANLRSPALPEMFDTTNHYGLSDALLREGPIRNFAKPVRGDNLWLLSSGSLAADSPSLLNSERLKLRFAELRKEFDFVLIDAPPLTRYADAIALGQITDGLILVLEANSTRREAALRVTNNLRSSQIRVLGAVLNKRTFPIPASLYKRL
jgi:capsular exopolysaccharide synthesis family protein